MWDPVVNLRPCLTLRLRHCVPRFSSADLNPTLTWLWAKGRASSRILFGWNGGILARRKNHLRVVLTLELIMRSVAVEVDADELERVSA